jgi:membrane protein
MKTENRKNIILQIRDFFRRDMWQMPLQKRSRLTRSAILSLRVLALVADGFRRNRCSLHAASLTLYSLLSLVPVLVLVLALARAFGGAELAREQINQQINAMIEKIEQGAAPERDAAAAQPTAAAGETDATAPGQAPEFPEGAPVEKFARQIRDGADKIFEQVNTIDFGKLGGFGAILLLWSVIGVLGKVEASFNQLWGVDKARPLTRKFTEYLAVIIILPFLVIAVSTVPVVQSISSVMESTMGARASSGVIALLDSSLLRVLMSVIGGTLTFAFLLGFMPNERVKVVPALVGGFITLVLFVVWMKLCAMLQIGIAKYSALYGGFAVLPILLLWVHTSWEIILLGAEISFAVQNRDTYMLEQFADEASVRARVLMAVTLCVESVQAARGPEGGAFDAARYAREKGVPHRFVTQILDQLAEHGFLAEVADHPGKYLLCKSSAFVRVADIVNALMNKGEAIESLGLEELSAPVAELNRRWRDTEKTALCATLDQLCVDNGGQIG